ncbi:MAG: DUF1653 domain-containing protein [Bilophila sp.]
MAVFYRHYKDRYYQLVGEALDTTDDSLVVVYRTLYPCEYSLFTRPKEHFFGTVRLADGTTTLRFTPIADADLPPDARAHVLQELPLLHPAK